jgi:hypothetical protein
VATLRPHTTLTFSFSLALLTVALAYAPILPATLVADDYRLLSPDFLERPLRYFRQDLFSDQPGQVYWRPLPVLTFALDRAIGGAGAVVPHLTNLLLHLATTAALGMLILSAGRSGTGGAGPAGRTSTAGRFGASAGAIAGMLLFGLHPQATGAVAWVAARFDLLAGLFGTIGLMLCVRRNATVEASPGRIIAILASFAAALLCKESAMAFPAAVFLWTLIETLRKRVTTRRREDVVFLISLVALGVTYVALRKLLIGKVGAGADVPFGAYWQTALGYLVALVWPFSSTGAVPRPPLYFGLMALALLALVVASVPRRPAKSEHAVATMPWALPVLLLVASLFSLTVGRMRLEMILRGAESRLSYTPLIAAAILAGWMLQRVATPRRSWWWSVALSLIACAALAWTQQYRVSEWEYAGHRVNGLLSQTVRLVPEPPPNSTFVFYGIPLTTESYCYLFGIGLPEAIAQRYDRSDLMVMRWGESLNEVPRDAYVFVFDARGGSMKLQRRPD